MTKKHRLQIKMRHGILLLLLLFLSVLFWDQKAEAAGYDIEQYHVDIQVSDQNIYTIQETIKVYFYTSRHGIYRNIPIKNQVIRADGSTAKIFASVRDVSCGSDEFSVSRNNGNYRIQIGDEDRTIYGEKVYHISYQYDMGNDVLREADEFYYNVIGTGWNCSIQNVTFSIQMPKGFDESKLGMAYGIAGSVNTAGLDYTVDGTLITGGLDSDIILYPGDGLTVRLELPDGYFIKRSNIPWVAVGAILLGVLTIVAGYVLWNTYGKDDPVVETVEFYAPEGLNSAEAAYAYKGYLPNEAVVSLIVFLAQKGYIEIREDTGSKWIKGFILIKKKDYDGLNQSERMFMQGLFAKGNVVTKKDLVNTFYKTVNSIVSQIKKQFKHKIFYADSLNKNWILYLMLAAVFLAAGYQPVYNYEFNMLAAIGYPLGAAFVYTCIFSILFSNGNLSVISRIIAFVGIAVVFGGASLALMGLPLLYADKLYQIAFVFAIIVSGVVAFFSAYMSKRTPYGNELLGKLEGFRKFLETAEKERLEAMVAENPQYFYDILPYTYALDVSDVWMKKFESIAIEPPSWHYNSNAGGFNVVAFRHFMDTTMSSATSAMISSPGGSGGGGGVSGGGSGGGGGGSW